MRGKTFTFTGLTGGVNLADSPYELGDNEARDLLNVVATGRGAIRKRPGCTSFAPTVSATDIHSLGSISTASGDFLVAGTADGLWSLSLNATATKLTSLTDAFTPWSFAQGPGGVYMSNGVDTPQKWTGSGAATNWTGTNVPNAKFLLYKGTRMWAANLGASYGGLVDPGSFITYSDLGDPLTFQLTDVVGFDPGDGEQITGIVPVGPYMLVVKPSKIWVVYDIDTGANRILTSGLGCLSHRSMAEGPGGVWFLGSDNAVYVTNGATTTRVSDPIAPLLSTLSSASQSTAAGVFFNNHYYLSLQLGVGARTLDFDTSLKSWFLHSFSPSDWEVWTPSNEPLLYASAGQSVVHAFTEGAGDDAGSSFESYWRGPYLTFGAPFLNKRVRRIHFDGTGLIRVGLSRDFAGQASFETEVNFSPDSTGIWEDGDGLWGEGEETWGGEAEVGEAEVLTPGVARAWSVQFGNQSTDPWEVNSYTLAITMRKN